MDIPFRIPGADGPEVTVRRTALGNVEVLVGGAKLKRRRGFGLSYDIPLPNGTTTELRLTGRWRGLKATVNGVTTPLEPSISPIFVILTFVPLVLVMLGGLIGALFGVATSAVNLALSRRRLPAPIKLATMLGTTILGIALYFGLAFLIAPVPAPPVGTCLNGVHEGGELTADAARGVDCAAPHENEVVGAITYSGGGSYPGQQAIFDYADQPCYDAFAAYVGIDFQQSVLEMILVTPTDVTWVKGDRAVSCIVLAPNGGKLTGSVRGTAR